MRAPPPPPPQAELEAEKEALEAQLEQERILAEKAEAQRLVDLAAAEKKKKEEQIAYRELELKKLTVRSRAYRHGPQPRPQWPAVALSAVHVQGLRLCGSALPLCQPHCKTAASFSAPPPPHYHPHTAA